MTSPSQIFIFTQLLMVGRGQPFSHLLFIFKILIMRRICIHNSFSRIDYMLHQFVTYIFLFSYHIVVYIPVEVIGTRFVRSRYISRTTDISPDEIPLLRVKMVNSEGTFTYPPSMCFFAGGDSLVIPAGVQRFIESKKSTLKNRMDEVASKAIQDLRIGDLTLGSDTAITEQKPDLQTQLLQETRQRLFGRNVSAWGSVLAVHDELWYFPNQIRFS